MNSKVGIAIAGAVVGSVTVGFILGTFYTKVRLEKLVNAELESLNAELQEEIQKIRAAYEDRDASDEEENEPYEGVPEASDEEQAEAEELVRLYRSPEVLTEEQATKFNEAAPFTVDGKDPSELEDVLDEPTESDIPNGEPMALSEDDTADAVEVGERFVKDLLAGGDDPKAETVDPEEDHTSSTLVITAEQLERITTGPIKINKNVFKDYKDEEPTELEKLQFGLQRDEAGKIIDPKPYVIPIGEYMNGYDDEGLELMTLWWYAGDGTLVDERDIPIPDVEGIVGRANLNHFGVGSDDSRVVYVRNNQQHSAYEILLHDGNYAEVVFGVGSGYEKTKNRPQKMRKSDY